MNFIEVLNIIHVALMNSISILLIL